MFLCRLSVRRTSLDLELPRSPVLVLCRGRGRWKRLVRRGKGVIGVARVRGLGRQVSELRMATTVQRSVRD